MKKIALNVDNLGQPLTPLIIATTRENKVRAMKNELMCHYRQHPLSSKKLDYIPYTTRQWDEFVAEKKIIRE
jgi:hypothetical protein